MISTLLTEPDNQWYIAQQWLWKSRIRAPASADIWDLRWRWHKECQELWQQVRNGSWRLSPMQVYHSRYQDVAQWGARDALILKWCALHAENWLPVHSRCEHRRGNGGGQQSIERVHAAITSGEYRFVFRTDIKGYYRHIIKRQLWEMARRYITKDKIAEIVKQYLWYSVEYGGEIHTPELGIPRGCALSPLMGGCLLYHIDAWFSTEEGIYYARYMDDFIIFTRTRWHLRRCIKRLNEFFVLHQFEQHPDKTIIGKFSRGFDWMGVAFNEHGATGIAPRALEHHRNRCLQLYEQACRAGLQHGEAMARVQCYRTRWLLWANRTIGGLNPTGRVEPDIYKELEPK